MSMFDSFFKQRFDTVKCKTLLKLTIPRIKLLRNRREVQLKQMRRDIAKLLETGQEATAQIRVEHILREENMMGAQEIIELFCELISARLPIVEAQRACPLDLKEAISSICFAAPRTADLTELLQVQTLFAVKYGKDFVDAATNLMPESGVNRKLVELLSVRAPAPDVKLNLLKEIAEEHGLDWDSSASESELLKPHEDLLNGPTQYVNGSKLPLPQVKLGDTNNSSTHTSTLQHSDDSDDDFEIIEFPEVPVGTIQANKDTIATAPEMLPFPASALSEFDDEEQPNENSSNLGPENIWSKMPSDQEKEDKQFLPFFTPPQYQASFPAKEHNLNVSFMTTNGNLDLQEVLAAAHTAAESAEHAAAAARSAQLRLSELVEKNNEFNDQVLDMNSFHLSRSNSDVEDEDKPTVFDDFFSSPTSQSQNYKSDHQQQRLPYMDEETYFSYPNLFTNGSNVGSNAQFTDSK